VTLPTRGDVEIALVDSAGALRQAGGVCGGVAPLGWLPALKRGSFDSPAPHRRASSGRWSGTAASVDTARVNLQRGRAYRRVPDDSDRRSEQVSRPDMPHPPIRTGGVCLREHDRHHGNDDTDNPNNYLPASEAMANCVRLLGRLKSCFLSS
jgi:hypothetical protein